MTGNDLGDCPQWNGIDSADLVRLEQLEDDCFANRAGIVPESRHLFGGQVMGQALVAAMHCTDPAYLPHAIHVLFLGAGDACKRVQLTVERLREGRSFAARRVRALQGQRVLLEMLVSFHVEEDDGMGHRHMVRGDIPPPEELETLAQYAQRTGSRLAHDIVTRIGVMKSVEVRPCGPLGLIEGEQPRRRFWLRMPAAGKVSDPAERLGLLAYLSDYWLASASLAGHEDEIARRYPTVTSLDHGLWLHRDADPSDWLLYDLDSPFAGNQLGLSRGSLYDRSGQLVASTSQQILMRTA